MTWLGIVYFEVIINMHWRLASVSLKHEFSLCIRSRMCACVVCPWVSVPFAFGSYLLLVESLLLHNASLLFCPERKALWGHWTTGNCFWGLPLIFMFWQNLNLKIQTKWRLFVLVIFKKKCLGKKVFISKLLLKGNYEACLSVIAYFCFPPHSLAVHTDSILHLAPPLWLEPSETFSVASGTRGTHFIFGPVTGAAVTAFQLAQLEIQAQIALQQLASLATITVGCHCHTSSGFAAVLPPLLLNLLSGQRVLAVGLNVDTNSKTYRNSQPCISTVMYHHHSQQQGSQPYSNGPRPPHHQPPQNQHQNRSSDMRSQVIDFQFPRPTQLPDELESALAIRGARDMDHRLIEHMSQPSQHQNQSSASAISQHGSYGSNPITITSDTQPSHQQGVDWSSYQPPTKLFASPPPSAGHPSQQQQGPQQQSQSNHAGTSIPNWTASVSGSPSPQGRHSHGGSGDSQGLYTPESAGSILASFGLSNDDLEVLSHYPDDQLTPDTLPFILRDIQINKSNNQKTVTSSSASSLSCTIHDMPLPASRSSTLTRSCSPEVPSLLTVTQTAGKVIDYGHASRAKDESSTRETFKREQLSSERTVKMYPSSPSSSSVQKADKVERRQVPRLEHKESSKHGDQDYRRANSDHRKNNLSPGREFPPTSKSRNQDHDYRHHRPKLRPSSETRSEASSRRSLSSSSGSKPQSSNKKLPTPTMRNDFSAVSPKVFPHTCSLCDIQCDQEKVSANTPSYQCERSKFYISNVVCPSSPGSCQNEIHMPSSSVLHAY